MHTDDPSATYRGYRRQALYALYRLFDDTLPTGCSLQPEGKEDLAIFDPTGRLIEVVQVKDHSRDLAVSSLKPPFFHRIRNFCKSGSTTTVRIASYGAIGRDLTLAKQGDSDAICRVVKSIEGCGLREAEAENIVSHIDLQYVTEQQLQRQIVEKLRSTVTGTAPEQAFDFLMWWLLTSSEKQRVIDRRLAVAKLEAIGRFLSARAAYHREWYQSIVPVCGVGQLDKDKLATEFYRGVGARYDHIAADLDVPRGSLLTRIHEALACTDIVILHSASGQGKTALAYRYIKEFSPSDFCFQVKSVQDLKHARGVALALTGHVTAVAIPSLVFLDVVPGDLNWVEVVKGLAGVEGLKILVAIREEDWRRSNVTKADFLFDDIELTFDRTEAEKVYKSLVEKSGTERYLDFEEAWTQFGEKKLLLEFVHFVTQSESLRDRIKAQVRTIFDQVRQGIRSKEEVEFLRIVSVATAYEARLNLQSACAVIDLPAPQRTVELYEKEHLLRSSHAGKFVEALHAIRSEILSEELTDPTIYPWDRVASSCIPLLAEEDIEAFLLCVFSRRPDSLDEIMEQLDGYQPATWVGLCGVVRALLWLGLRRYITENERVIEDAREIARAGWYVMLDFDVGLVQGDEGFRLFDKLGESFGEAAKRSREFKNRQTPKSRVFDPVKDWLRGRRDAPSPPKSVAGLLSMAEVLFWIGWVEIETPVSSWFSRDQFRELLGRLHVEHVGDFVRGVRQCFPNWYADWLQVNREWLLEEIRRPAGFCRIDDDGDSMVGHFFVDLDQNASTLRRRDDANAAATIHHITSERIELLSQLFPGKSRYGSIGYGHRSTLVPADFDEGEKPGVLAEALPPAWPPRLNSLFRGLAELAHRPHSWDAFFSDIISLRRRVLGCLEDLAQAIGHYLENQASDTAAVVLSHPQAWDECREALRENLLFPRVAVDEWGINVEGSREKESQHILSTRYASTTRLDGFRRAFNEYTRTVQNFLNQSFHGMVLIPHLRRAPDERTRLRVRRVAQENGINEESIRLSIINLFDASKAVPEMQSQFDRLVTRVSQLESVESLNQNEREIFRETLDVWCRYVEPQKRITPRAGKKSKRRRRSIKLAKIGIEALLQPIRNTLKSNLQSLRKHRIRASVLSESVEWQSYSSLWIACDVSHPVETALIPEQLWKALQATFRPYEGKTLHQCVIDHYWRRIVVVPLVRGRSLSRQAWPNFAGATYWHETSLEEQMWRLFPDDIPESAWTALGLAEWEQDSRLLLFAEFTASYLGLMRHVDHMADLRRMPEEIDDEGAELLQNYLNREAERAQAILQETFDSCARLLDFVNDIPFEDKMRRPNLMACMEFLGQLDGVIQPTPDFKERATMNLDEAVEWRDRLHGYFGTMGVGSLFWTADVLNLPSYSE